MIREAAPGDAQKKRPELLEAPDHKKDVINFIPVFKAISRKMETELFSGRKSSQEVIDGFEDVIGHEPLGSGLFHNTQGSAYQLSFAITLSPSPDVKEILKKGSPLASGEAIRFLREKQVLAGLKIMDLGCGFPGFALAAKALGANVYTADAEIIAPENRARLDGHTIVDFNDTKAAERLVSETGGKFDLVTENIIGGVPSAIARVQSVNSSTIEHIAAALLKSGGYLYRPTQPLDRFILRKK